LLLVSTPSGKSPFNRQIHVFIRDAHQRPIPGATIHWKINGQDAGTTQSDGGGGSITLQSSDAKVGVEVTYEGHSQAATLAVGQDTLTFHFPDVDLYPMKPSFVNEHLAFVAGLVLIAVALVLAFVFSTPTPLQTRIILVVAALGGGAFATELSGMIQVNVSLGQRLAIGATGALAVFVILYFAVPATT
jgi:hypothetical protein